MMRLLAILLCFSNCCLAQTRFTAYNQQQANKSKEGLKSVCRQFGSKPNIDKKDIEADKRKIAFLNDFYNKDLSVEEVTKLIRRYKLHGYPDSSDLGGAMRYEMTVGGKYSNLRTEIIFTTFRGQVVYKCILIESRSECYCLDTLPARYIGFSDVKYFEDYCFPYMDFPLDYKVFFTPAIADTLLLQKLANQSTDPYKMLPQDSVKLNCQVWGWYSTYIFGGTLHHFKSFIKARDTAFLFRLLYSPNHIVALYTMEALIYLQETGQVPMPADIIQKMEQLKNSGIVFRKRYFDVGGTAAYKELQISKEHIVSKYKELMSKGD